LYWLGLSEIFCRRHC